MRDAIILSPEAKQRDTKTERDPKKRMEATRTRKKDDDSKEAVESPEEAVESPEEAVESPEESVESPEESVESPEECFVNDRDTAAEIIDKESVEGDEPTLSVPLISTPPADQRSPKEEEKEETLERVLDVCVVCREPVPFRGEFVIKTGCCETEHHLTCMLGTNWLPSNKGITCPVCSHPDDVPGVEENMNKIKDAYFSRKDRRSREGMDTELISALYKHMLRGAASGGFKATFNMWATGDVTHGFQFMAENGVSLDDLLGLNFGIDTIRRHVATSLDQLISIGFTAQHLKRFENDLHALIALYDINIHTLCSSLGRASFTVSRIIDLRLGARAMADLGITTHQLCLMKMTKIRIPEFKNVSMQEWVSVMGMRKCHVRLLRIKQADFSRILKPVRWNYIGLKDLLKISDAEAVELGMTDSLNKYSVNSRTSSPEDTPRRGRQRSQKNRRKGGACRPAGRGGPHQDHPAGRGGVPDNRRERRNSFNRFENGGAPHLSLQPAPPPGSIPAKWTRPVADGRFAAPQRGGYGSPDPHYAPYAASNGWHPPPGGGYYHRGTVYYPPTTPGGRGHLVKRFPVKPRGRPAQDAGQEQKPRFTVGRPLLTHRKKKELVEQRKRTTERVNRK